MRSGLSCAAVSLAVTALTLGCSASMVTRPGNLTPVANAPVNEATRPGVVRYLNEGIGSVRDARRRSAYSKMQAACSGPYRIDTEGERLEGGVVVPTGVAAVFSQSRYWYIQFSCVRSSDQPARP